MIFTGNIGSTKTLFALYELVENQLLEVKTLNYANKEYESLEIILNDFLKKINTPLQAVVSGIHGPVINGTAKSTNFSWMINKRHLSEMSGVNKVKLVGNIVATAFAIPSLSEDEKIIIKEGNNNKDSDRFVVIVPETGLGHAILVYEEDKKIVIPIEGDQVDFAPANELEINLYMYLKKKFNRVTYERIISIPGLINVFDFLVECGYGEFSDETFERMLIEDKAEVIMDMALNGEDKFCKKTVDIFISILGSYARNLVINLMATGGVYIGGVIPQKILPILKEDTFKDSFLDKDGSTEVVESTPVNVIKNKNVNLPGVVRIAIG